MADYPNYKTDLHLISLYIYTTPKSPPRMRRGLACLLVGRWGGEEILKKSLKFEWTINGRFN